MVSSRTLYNRYFTSIADGFDQLTANAVLPVWGAGARIKATALLTLQACVVLQPRVPEGRSPRSSPPKRPSVFLDQLRAQPFRSINGPCRFHQPFVIQAAWSHSHKRKCTKLPLLKVGAKVRTKVALDADVVGKGLRAGTEVCQHRIELN
jgi:hypothetical protein